MTQHVPGETANALSVRRIAKSKSALLGAVALGALGATGAIEGVLYAPGSAIAQTAQVPQAKPVPAQMPSFADVVDRVKPAVVSVRVKTAASQVSQKTPGMGDFNLPDLGLPDDHPFQDFVKRFGGPGGQDGNEFRFGRPDPGPRQGMAQGSGFFFSADGYHVTNNHVIEKNSDVEVLTDDGRTLNAKVVGTDPKTDLALLKVEGKDFPFVELDVTGILDRVQ